MHDRIGVTKIGYVDRPLSDIYAIGMDVLNIDIPSRSVFVPISYMKKNTISIMVDFGHQQSQHVQMASKDLLRGKIRILGDQTESIMIKGSGLNGTIGNERICPFKRFAGQRFV